jgi:hypothetical protein
MAALIGIDLSPVICRIVDVDVQRAMNGLRPTRLRRFSVLQQATPEMTAALAALHGRSAAVVVWGAPSDHRQVMVSDGNYLIMRREATRALALAGVDTRGALIDIARAPFDDNDTRRRPVVVAVASGAAVQAAIAPLREAGIDIKVIATPATALASLARARRFLTTSPQSGCGASPSVQVDAYVAIEESATCIALLRDGTLAAARELSWGFLERRRYPRRREDIAVRIVEELSEFLTTVGGSVASLRKVVLCGGAAELGSIAADLTKRFDVEVEPLLEPFGFATALDAAIVERCADLWMAWAVAVDQQTPLNLIHLRRRQFAQARFARAAVAAGIVVGVGLAWEAARCALRTELVPAVHNEATVRPTATLQQPPYGAAENLK